MSRLAVGLFDTFGHAETALREIEGVGISCNDVSIVANNADNAYASWQTRTGSDYCLSPAGVGAVAGGLIGALVDIGIPEEEAEYYAEGVRRGGTLVSVSAPDSQINQVVAVLNWSGAVDIDQRCAYYQQTGYPGYDRDAPFYTVSELQAERERLRAHDMFHTDISDGHVRRDLGGGDGTRSGVAGNLSGLQTGEGAANGSGRPDTRGFLDKTADALTGDRIDDKTARLV